MHIPDGYLSPATCGVLGASMVPVWATAGKRVRKVVTSRSVPLLALGAAYSFVVMMFNVPIPDGTTAHAVGAVLIAILLGPWAAVVAVSVALAIQALFFGDGGVLSFGANCLNMAFVMPMVGYGIYHLGTRHVSLTARRRALVAGFAGYAGINAAAVCAAVELGLQPTLFHSANGTPLYSPFHLRQTSPAWSSSHSPRGWWRISSGRIFPSCASTTPAFRSTRPTSRHRFTSVGDEERSRSVSPRCSRRSASSRREPRSPRPRAGAASGITHSSPDTASAPAGTPHSVTSSPRSSAWSSLQSCPPRCSG